MMKLGYNTIRKVAADEGELKPLTNARIPEGELKPLTNARIPEGGGRSGITKKKHLLFFALGMVIIGFLMGNLLNDHHLGLPLNKESSVAAQLVDSIEESEIQLYVDPNDPAGFGDHKRGRYHPSFDHQTKTYESKYEPYSGDESVVISAFFSPDHSVDTLVDFIQEAKETLDIYTPSYSMWTHCTPYKSKCSGCKPKDMRASKFPLFAAIVNAANNGVAVRIITNDFGDQTCKGNVTGFDFLDLQDNITVKTYTTTTFVHTKYMMLDGKKASVSSVNWSKTSFTRNREAGIIIDAGDLNSGAIDFFASVFEGDWEMASDYKVQQKYSPADMEIIKDPTPIDIPTVNISNIPGAYVTPKPKPEFVNTHITAWAGPDFSIKQVLDDIQSATSTLDIMIYQVTDPYVCDAIADAAKKVTVRLLVSSDIYSKYDNEAAFSCYEKLHKGGLSARLTPSYYKYSHQKFWIVDGVTVALSSGNWSPSDMPNSIIFPVYPDEGWVDSNRDLNIRVEDSDFAAIFTKVIDEDWKRGTPILYHPLN